MWGVCWAAGDESQVCTEPQNLHVFSGGLFTTLRTTRRCGWSDLRERSFFEKSATKARQSALGTLPDPSGELFDVIEDFTTLGHLGQDLALGVHDRGVIAAERLADLGQ